jgi:hypothetical protein
VGPTIKQPSNTKETKDTKQSPENSDCDKVSSVTIRIWEKKPVLKSQNLCQYYEGMVNINSFKRYLNVVCTFQDIGKKRSSQTMRTPSLPTHSRHHPGHLLSAKTSSLYQ